mmetsp:Transcript_1520/g.3375  ORF Transcript_1520/g.3375 Transcript_1520/m.3375 type:complete len:96 (-) Transcript_1520:1350-1637(-)
MARKENLRLEQKRNLYLTPHYTILESSSFLASCQPCLLLDMSDTLQASQASQSLSSRATRLNHLVGTTRKGTRGGRDAAKARALMWKPLVLLIRC